MWKLQGINVNSMLNKYKHLLRLFKQCNLYTVSLLFPSCKYNQLLSLCNILVSESLYKIGIVSFLNILRNLPLILSSSMELLLFPVGTWMSKPAEPVVAGTESPRFCQWVPKGKSKWCYSYCHPLVLGPIHLCCGRNRTTYWVLIQSHTPSRRTLFQKCTTLPPSQHCNYIYKRPFPNSTKSTASGWWGTC